MCSFSVHIYTPFSKSRRISDRITIPCAYIQHHIYICDVFVLSTLLLTNTTTYSRIYCYSRFLCTFRIKEPNWGIYFSNAVYVYYRLEKLVILKHAVYVEISYQRGWEQIGEDYFRECHFKKKNAMNVGGNNAVCKFEGISTVVNSIFGDSFTP